MQSVILHIFSPSWRQLTSLWRDADVFGAVIQPKWVTVSQESQDSIMCHLKAAGIFWPYLLIAMFNVHRNSQIRVAVPFFRHHKKASLSFIFWYCQNKNHIVHISFICIGFLTWQIVPLSISWLSHFLVLVSLSALQTNHYLIVRKHSHLFVFIDSTLLNTLNTDVIACCLSEWLYFIKH